MVIRRMTDRSGKPRGVRLRISARDIGGSRDRGDRRGLRAARDPQRCDVTGKHQRHHRATRDQLVFLDPAIPLRRYQWQQNATRHGDLDVFAVLYMMERHGWSTDEVRKQLAQGGGLAGLSGVAGGDLRDIEAASAA